MKERRYNLYLMIGVFAYNVFFSVYSILRHYLYLTAGYDLGIFMQSLWTTATGEGFFFNTAEWQDLGVHSHFGVHNQPILLLLIPVYKIFPYAETLLIIQTIAIGSGAITLFKFAKLCLKDEKRAFYISLMYLTNPLIHGINRMDFHPVGLAIPFIFLIPYYFEKREYIKMFLTSFIILSVKEDSGLILISLGLMYILRRYPLKEFTNPRKWKKIFLENKIPTLLIIIGSLWIVVSLFMVVPYFGGEYPYFSGKLERYGGKIYFDNIVVYFIVNIISTAFLPLLNIQLFFSSLPLWLEIFLSSHQPMVIIGTQYPYMLVPMLLIMSVYNLKEIKNAKIIIKKVNEIQTIQVSLRKLVGVSMLSMMLFSPAFHVIDSQYIWGMPIQKMVPLYINGYPYLNMIDEVTETLTKTNYTIATQNQLFPHLANRQNTYYLLTYFGNGYIPNNSLVVIDTVIPDYKPAFKYFTNYTKTHQINFQLLNTTELILTCARDDIEKTRECIHDKLNVMLQDLSDEQTK